MIAPLTSSVRHTHRGETRQRAELDNAEVWSLSKAQPSRQHGSTRSNGHQTTAQSLASQLVSQVHPCPAIHAPRRFSLSAPAVLFHDLAEHSWEQHVYGGRVRPASRPAGGQSADAPSSGDESPLATRSGPPATARWLRLA